MPNGSGPIRSNHERRKTPEEFDIEENKVEQENSEELLSKAESMLEQFEKGGLPEAEKIAAEFGVEVDEETATALRILDHQARQIKEAFNGSLRGKVLHAGYKILNKTMPNSRLAKGFSSEAQWALEEKRREALPYYNKKQMSVEEILAYLKNEEDYARGDKKLDIRRYDEYLSHSISKTLEEKGWKEAIKEYEKIPTDKIPVNNLSNLQGSIARVAVDSKIDPALKGQLSHRQFEELREDFKNSPEILLNLNQSRKFLDQADLAELISKTPDKPGIDYFIAGNAMNLDREEFHDELPEDQFEKVKDKMFQSFVALESPQLIHYAPKLTEQLAQLDDETNRHILNEFAKRHDAYFANKIQYFNVPDDMKETLWQTIVENDTPSTPSSNLVKDFLDNIDGQKKLNVTQTDVIKAICSQETITSDFAKWLQYKASDEQRKVAIEHILETQSPEIVFLNIKYLKEFVTPQELNILSQKALDSEDFRQIQSFFPLAKEVNLSEEQKAQLKNFIIKADSRVLFTESFFNYLENFDYKPEDIFELFKSDDMTRRGPLIAYKKLRGHLTPDQRKIINAKIMEHPEGMVTFISGVNFDEEEKTKYAPLLYEQVFKRSYDKVGELKNVYQETGIKAQFAPSFREETENDLKSLVPSSYTDSLETLKNITSEEFQWDTLGWAQFYNKLLKLQARSQNSEYDPWVTDLDKLFAKAKYEHTINPDDPKSAEVVYDYVKEYGMYNLPRLFEWHVAVSKVKKLEDIDPEIKKQIESDLKVDISKIETKGKLINEIKRLRSTIQEELLEDKIPQALLDTKIGMEIFLQMKGSTQWGRNEDPANLIETLQETKEAHPELTQLPEGYTEFSFEVPEVVRRDNNVSEQDGINNKIEKLLNNPDVQQAYQQLDLAVKQAEEMLKEDSNWWERTKEELLSELDDQTKSVENKKASLDNPTAQKGMDVQLAKIEEAKTKLQALVLEPNDPQQWLEELIQSIPKNMKNRSQILREVSVSQMIELMSQEMKDEILNSERAAGEKITTYRNWLVDYVNEHYLNTSQEEHQTGHPPFSKELTKELQFLYGIKPDFKKNLLVQTADKLKILNEGGEEVSDKMVGVTMVPSKGVLRIFAGDIGDACYTSKHENLAKGEYKDLASFTFVTGRGTADERIKGSVLAIESKDVDGEKVLMVRANNPQENFLNQVSSDVLIEKTLNAMKELAQRRGIKKIVVPRDVASASCSNRKKVADFYNKNFSENPKVGLQVTPETEFNGYRNWDSSGPHAVVEI